VVKLPDRQDYSTAWKPASLHYTSTNLASILSEAIVRGEIWQQFLSSPLTKNASNPRDQHARHKCKLLC
jgi:hypothetical protein